MYHIILNPKSGRKKTNVNKLKKVFKYLKENDIEYKLYQSEYFRHPIELANQITTENESGKIIVIGGDGTISEVIIGIRDLAKWNIGLIPLGSGNDFANCIGLPKKKPLESLKLILKEEVKPVDYIKVNDMICVNVLGTGIDVEVLLHFEKHTKLKGSLRYFVSLIDALRPIKWHEFDVSIDDGPFEHKKGFIIALCNGKNIGGGISICPVANPSDNKLEFVFVDQIKGSQIPKYLLKLMSKKILTLPKTEHITCTKAVFKDNKNLLIQIDGNITQKYNEYCCEIVNNGLNMYR